MEKQIDLDFVKKIHFVGVGGISMSALVKLSKSMGKECTGSDQKETKSTRELKKSGIKVYIKHRRRNVKKVDLVVYSSAVGEDNVEVSFAKERGIPVLERSAFLGLISKVYKNVIAVAGTHGKTTTTAMISNIFLRYGFNPTIHIGGEYSLISGNLRVGGGEFFITEACEFRDSFLCLKPNISLITNIESEHLDYFKKFSNIKKSFTTFYKQTKDLCFINYKYKRFIENYNDNLLTFGLNKNADIFAKNIVVDCEGCYKFDCYKKGLFLGNVQLKIPGKHNVLNALGAISVCLNFNIPFKRIASALKQFSNVQRRFENVGLFNEGTVIHDYAHHPTEIRETIKTCKNAFRLPVVCIFQPHTYSRTKMLMKSFCRSFSNVETLVILETYSAREKFDVLGSATYLKTQLQKQCKDLKVEGVFNKKEINTYLKKNNFKGKVLLFLGAGDIEDVVKGLKTKFIP